MVKIYRQSLVKNTVKMSFPPAGFDPTVQPVSDLTTEKQINQGVEYQRFIIKADMAPNLYLEMYYFWKNNWNIMKNCCLHTFIDFYSENIIYELKQGNIVKNDIVNIGSLKMFIY